MARADDDDLWEGDFQEVEFGVPRLRRGRERDPRLDQVERVGGGPGSGGSGVARWRWAVGGLVVGIGVAVALAVFGAGGDDSSAPTTAPPVVTDAPVVTEVPPLPSSTVPDTAAPGTTGPVPAAHVWLAVRTAGELVLVDDATGDTERWVAPDLDDAAAVSMVVGADFGILVPAGGTGWFTRAGTDPVALDTGLMQPPGPVFPGPRPHTVWKYDESSGVLTLLGSAGEYIGQAVPGSDALPVGSDDLGTVVFQSADAAFLATEAGVEYVTDGYVVAIGATDVVAVECNSRLGCFNVAIRRSDGRPILFGGEPIPQSTRLGRVSPTGAAAAIVTVTDTGPSLVLVDLATGAVLVERPALATTGLVWSPDGRSLYYVGVDGEVHVVSLDVPDTDLVMDVGPEPVLDIGPVGPAELID